MVYIKQTWTNDDPATPLSGPRMSHIEDGIAQADADANAPLGMAGLNTLGLLEGIFIPNEGTLPGDLPIYALVIEQE